MQKEEYECISIYTKWAHTCTRWRKKKNQRCCIPQVPFGRPLNRYPDPIPTKVATILKHHGLLVVLPFYLMLYYWPHELTHWLVKTSVRGR